MAIQFVLYVDVPYNLQKKAFVVNKTNNGDQRNLKSRLKYLH